MLVPEADGASIVSVGVEPLGVPPGVIALGGGPPAFLDLLRDQLDRRDRCELPLGEGEPGWALRIDGLDPELERAHESLLTLADGRIGTAGSPVAAHPTASPTVFAAGLYDGDGPDTTLLECPAWNQLPCRLGKKDEISRVLDLRAGVLRQDLRFSGNGSLCAALFSSLARPSIVAMRAAGPSELLRSHSPLAPAGSGTGETATPGALPLCAAQVLIGRPRRGLHRQARYRRPRHHA
jgi:hypothetical protein